MIKLFKIGKISMKNFRWKKQFSKQDKLILVKFHMNRYQKLKIKMEK